MNSPRIPDYAVIQAVRQHHSELAHAANIRALHAARLNMIAANDVLETSAMERYDRIIERIVTGTPSRKHDTVPCAAPGVRP